MIVEKDNIKNEDIRPTNLLGETRFGSATAFSSLSASRSDAESEHRKPKYPYYLSDCGSIPDT